SPLTFLSGARRQCRSPSAFRYYFSRKGFIERRPAGCVKAIAMAGSLGKMYIAESRVYIYVLQ
ncbi:MAG TPA: hypothetical protein VIS53_02110, partial [Candidatus Udaeobacter sp.]